MAECRMADAYRGLLVDAIVGRGFPTMVQADRFTRDGLARFTGNQHNDAWTWDRERLEFLPVEKLETIYQELGGRLG
jgi:hypothetical protein